MRLEFALFPFQRVEVSFLPSFRPSNLAGISPTEDLGYSNGAYYKQEPPKQTGADPTYKVVKPPLGATVPNVPKGAKKSTIGGVECYEYAGIYYQIFHSGSKVVYMVVKNPNA